MNWFERLLTNHRGMVIFLFAVPMSFLYQKWEDLQNWIYRTFRNTNKAHDAKVKQIQEIVKQGYASGQQMCTARKPWKAMSIRSATFKSKLFQVPIDLRNVLEIDEKRGILRAEPMATMGDLTHYLVPRGLALAVQVEMDDLTLGGLCMGVGIETSSHRCGLLFETVEAYEIITADGSLVRATRDENPDLFRALPWSHGTLGFLVAVELKIVPIQSHVALTYHPYHSMTEFCQEFQRLATAETPPYFLEALVFSPETGVIMCGEFAAPTTPEQRASINPTNRFYKRWFFSHVADFLKRPAGSAPVTEYIPTRHYFHRHTPSVFFQLKDLISFANTAWYRWFFGWMGAPKISLMKLSMTKELRRQAFENRVAQDILIPVDKIQDGIEFMCPRYEIFPMWVCPVRFYNHGEHEGLLRNPKDESESTMFVDLGVYGIPASVERGTWDTVKVSRELEEFSRSVDGYQMLYADIFMTKDEFEDMFEHKLYREMRKKYNAEKAFPEVYDKVLPENWLFNIPEAVAKLAPAEAPQKEAPKAKSATPAATTNSASDSPQQNASA